jgi:hypothetical protein
MNGWKTTAGAIGTMCTGIAMIIKAVVTDPIEFNSIWEGILVIVSGLSIFGIGGKLQKIINANNTEVSK